MEFSAAIFAPHRSETFRVDRGGSALKPLKPLELELVEVAEQPASAGIESFSLLFRGPRSSFLTQRAYPLLHETLGEFSLFLVPVGPDAQGHPLYEAAFQRLREP